MAEREKGITARRVYNDENQLIGGVWMKEDGSRTIYQCQKAEGGKRNAGGDQSSATENLQFNIHNLNVWQLAPSAKDFTEIIGNPTSTKVEERGSTYVVTYQSETPGGRPSAKGDDQASAGLVSAALTLNKSDLHATDLLLQFALPGSAGILPAPDSPTSALDMGSGQDARAPRLTPYSFHFTEIRFEQRPVNTVASENFEPDAEFLNAAQAKPMVAPKVEAPPIATPQLEIETLNLLSKIGADLAQEVFVTGFQAGY